MHTHFKTGKNQCQMRKTNVDWWKQKRKREKKNMSARVKPLNLWPESVDQKQQI
jgi:hypothetical protein